MIGSGIGGLQAHYEASVLGPERKIPRLSPLVIPSALVNLVSGPVSVQYGLKGPNHSAVPARATVVDGLQLGYRVIVPREAVGDRSPEAHEQNLVDIQGKYGDVLPLKDVLERLAGG